MNLKDPIFLFVVVSFVEIIIFVSVEVVSDYVIEVYCSNTNQFFGLRLFGNG
jgi:hypothetical protein